MNRLRVLVGAGVDNAEISQRSQIAGLGFENRLKTPLSTNVILCGESPDGLFEGGLERVGGNQSCRR